MALNVFLEFLLGFTVDGGVSDTDLQQHVSWCKHFLEKITTLSRETFKLIDFCGTIHIKQRQTSKEKIRNTNTIAYCEWVPESSS